MTFTRVGPGNFATSTHTHDVLRSSTFRLHFPSSIFNFLLLMFLLALPAWCHELRWSKVRGNWVTSNNDKEDHGGSDSVFCILFWDLQTEWLFPRSSAHTLDFHCFRVLFRIRSHRKYTTSKSAGRSVQFLLLIEESGSYFIWFLILGKTLYLTLGLLAFSVFPIPPPLASILIFLDLLLDLRRWGVWG